MCIAYTHCQASLRDSDSESLGGALQTTCLMLFNPYHQARWGMAENSWEASALKLPLLGNSQMAFYMSSPSIKYLSSTYEFCIRDAT